MKKNNRLLKYIIMGDPIPLARQRMTKSHVYDSQKPLKCVIMDQLRDQHKGHDFYEGPLLMTITFFMPISRYKKNHKPREPHSVRPDLSNLIKFYEDVANGILFKDDALIACIIARKQYDENPRTEFTLEAIEDEK